jgi:hypothetical protein
MTTQIKVGTKVRFVKSLSKHAVSKGDHAIVLSTIGDKLYEVTTCYGDAFVVNKNAIVHV